MYGRCERALEDIATWMGVPDECFRLLSYNATADDEDGGPKAKHALTIAAGLRKSEHGAAAASGNAQLEPTELGEATIAEFTNERLSGGLVATAQWLGLAAVPLTSVTMATPTRADFGAHVAPLADSEADARRELGQVSIYVDKLDSMSRADRAADAERTVERAVVKQTVQRLLAAREVRFSPTRPQPAASRLGASSSPQLTDESAEFEALRAAIDDDPIATAAATTLHAFGSSMRVAAASPALRSEAPSGRPADNAPPDVPTRPPADAARHRAGQVAALRRGASHHQGASRIRQDARRRAARPYRRDTHAARHHHVAGAARAGRQRHPRRRMEQGRRRRRWRRWTLLRVLLRPLSARTRAPQVPTVLPPATGRPL